MQRVQDPIEGRSGGHQAGINSTTDGPAERIPPPVIEPVQKVQETLCRQELGGSEVEVRVEFVNHRLVADLCFVFLNKKLLVLVSFSVSEREKKREVYVWRV